MEVVGEAPKTPGSQTKNVEGGPWTTHAEAATALFGSIIAGAVLARRESRRPPGPDSSSYELIRRALAAPTIFLAAVTAGAWTAYQIETIRAEDHGHSNLTDQTAQFLENLRGLTRKVRRAAEPKPKPAPQPQAPLWSVEQTQPMGPVSREQAAAEKPSLSSVSLDHGIEATAQAFQNGESSFTLEIGDFHAATLVSRAAELAQQLDKGKKPRHGLVGFSHSSQQHFSQRDGLVITGTAREQPKNWLGLFGPAKNRQVQVNLTNVIGADNHPTGELFLASKNPGVIGQVMGETKVNPYLDAVFKAKLGDNFGSANYEITHHDTLQVRLTRAASPAPTGSSV